MEELKISYIRLQRAWFLYLKEYKPETEPGVYENEFEDFVDQVKTMTEFMVGIKNIIEKNDPKISRKAYLELAFKISNTTDNMDRTRMLMSE